MKVYLILQLPYLLQFSVKP
jgi:translation initiation factor 2 subunit 1